MSRFDYVKYDNQSAEIHAQFKEEFQKLEFMIQGKLNPGRASSLILTHLEEAYMWVGKAVGDDQLKRDGSTELEENRNTS